jgi:hypothetical protein
MNQFELIKKEMADKYAETNFPFKKDDIVRADFAYSIF